MDYEEVYDFLARQDRLVRCELFYELVVEERNGLLRMDSALDDYLLCKALAACYELQDYLANCIARERLLRDGGEYWE